MDQFVKQSANKEMCEAILGSDKSNGCIIHCGAETVPDIESFIPEHDNWKYNLISSNKYSIHCNLHQIKSK